MTSSETPSRLQQLRRRFDELYGAGDVRVLRAPARINVLGEHVDYVSYLPTASLPFGSREHGMTMFCRATTEPRVRGASMIEEFAPFSFLLNEVPVRDETTLLESQWSAWLYERAVPAPHWSNYVKGSVFFAALKHSGQMARGFDFLLDSTIPPKGGASSSSALAVLAGAAMRAVNDIEFDLHELALDSSKAEWFVGTRGGAMDHTAICLARAGHAIHLRYAEQQAELVPLPDERFRWVTFFTHEADKGKEVMLAYNERAAVARILIPAILAREQLPLAANSFARMIDELPEAITFDEVAQRYPEAFAECQRAFPALLEARCNHPLKIRDRARHHLGEVHRVTEAVNLLRENSSHNQTERMQQLGALISATHRSLRDLYEVCTPQVNQMIELLNQGSQVFGARLMGGGFGGNVLALTTTENVEPLIEFIQREFYAPQQRDGMLEGAVMISTPGDGLSEINL